ncbi:unnamed protein product, partial [Heterosigma akashiwo]
AEIDKACNIHFKDFLTSVQTIGDLKSDAYKLREQMETLNTDLQRSGKAYLELGQKMARQKETLVKIHDAKQLIEKTQRLVQLMAAAEFYVKNKQYYNAIDTLEEIEQRGMGSQTAPLSALLDVWGPQTADTIKEAVKSEVRVWMLEARAQVGS